MSPPNSYQFQLLPTPDPVSPSAYHYGTRNIAEVLTIGNAVDLINKMDIQVTEKRRKDLWFYFYEHAKNNPKILWKSPRRSLAWQMAPL